MKNYSKLDWALSNYDFQVLVSDFLKSIQNQSNLNQIEPAIVNSALLYSNALFYEASPYYKGKRGLRMATELSCYESKLMFNYLRDVHEDTGQPMLFSLMQSGYVN
jgi:hypothetical protein